MNSKKYDGKYHEFRKISDLREMLLTSTDLFAEKIAYLEKDKKLKKYMPITYRQVREDMEAFGTKLIEMGLKGKKIAVIGDTSYKWILTYFATVAGVGVIVPMDKALPAGELVGLIDRAKASAIVFANKSKKSLAELFEKPGTIEYFISMEAEEDEDGILSMNKLIEEGKKLVAGGDKSWTDTDVDPDQMSTLLFTSGTTGMAKGVMLSHRGLASNVYSMSKYFEIPKDGIVYSILPIHHVYEMTCDIMTTFYQGQTIAICEGLKHLMQNMNEVHANVMLGVPLVFEKIHQGIMKTAKKNGQYEKLQKGLALSKKLKLYKNPAIVKKLFKAVHDSLGGAMEKMVAGGAAADAAILEDFEAMGFTMIQGYGMTECSPIVALNPDRYRKCAAAGKALPGDKLRVINQDEDGIGEVIIKSPSIMMGYYENEEATAEAIQDGWLHTGDLGYFDEDGFLYLTGRCKTVIVTKGGKNIFPEEVEAVLLEDGHIKEVVVHGIEDGRTGTVTIAADIFPNYDMLKEENGEMTKSDIYHYFKDLVDKMNESMPPYKRVMRVNIRETEFVKTTTGKIKRYGNRAPSAAEIREGGKLEYRDQKLLELKKMKRFVKDIEKSQDPYVVHKNLVPVTDVKDLLSYSLDQYKDNTAFIYRSYDGASYVQLTYQQAQTDIDGFGTALINRGLDSRRIAVFGGNAYQWEVSFLTVMSGVGVIVPIDKELDDAEILRQLKETNVTVAVVEEVYKDKFLKIKAEYPELETIITYGEHDENSFAVDPAKVDNGDGTLAWHALVNEGKEQVSQGDRQFLDAEVRGSDTAAIIYTAGRSGSPKGVVITHTNIVTDLISASSMVEFTPQDTVFSMIPADNMFEVGLGVLMPLYKGAAVVSAEGSDKMYSKLEEVRPTVFLAGPEMIQELHDSIIEASKANGLYDRLTQKEKKTGLFSRNVNDQLKPVKEMAQRMLGGRMRMVISGGAVINPEILDLFSKLEIAALQGYGLTEAAPIAAISPDTPEFINSAAAGHILPGIDIKLIDRNRDGIGEILVKGDNVTSGYYNDEEATKAAISDGWLHTGDLGFIDENGFVHLTGRKN